MPAIHAATPPLMKRFLYMWRVLRESEQFRRRPGMTVTRLGTWIALRGLRRPARLPMLGDLADVRIAVPDNAWQMYVFREPLMRQRELDLLRLHLQPGMVVLDVGAWLGFWSVTVAKRVGPMGRVVAFEPAEATSNLFEETVAENGLDQVTVLQSAVADTPGVTRLYHHGDWTRHSLGDTGEGHETVARTTVDCAVNELALERVDAIKIDVEGAEELVLCGALGVIERDHPVIVFEVNPEDAVRLGLSSDGAWRWLHDRGYALYRVDKAGNLNRLETLKPPSGDSRAYNLVAVHPRSELHLDSRLSDETVGRGMVHE